MTSPIKILLSLFPESVEKAEARARRQRLRAQAVSHAAARLSDRGTAGKPPVRKASLRAGSQQLISAPCGQQ